MSLGLLVQKIFLCTVIWSQSQTLKIALAILRDTLKASTLPCKIEILRVAHIFIGVHAVVAIGLIQRRGALLIFGTDIALILQKMAKPIILAAVFLDCLLHTLRYGNLIVTFDDFLRTLDDPWVC